VAQQHQEKGLSRCFVAILEAEPSRICGFFALTLTEVDPKASPDHSRKRLPRVIPGVRLGRLAIDREYQKRGLGELLLINAIERTRQVGEHAGVVGLFVDAIDERAALFYAHYGFVAFEDDPLKLYLHAR